MIYRIRQFIEREQTTFWMLIVLVLLGSLTYLHHSMLPINKTTLEQSVGDLDPTKADAQLKLKEQQLQALLTEDPALAWKWTSLFSLVVMTGTALLVGWMVNPTHRQRWSLPAQPVLDAVWGFNDFFRVIVFVFFSETMIVLVFHLWMPSTASQKIGTSFLLMTHTLIRDMAVLGMIIYTVKKRLRGSLAGLGLVRRDFALNLLKGAAGYLAVIPVLLLTLVGTLAFAKLFQYEPPVQPVVRILMSEAEPKNLWYFGIFVAVAGPFMEEVFFRGFTYPLFKKRWGSARAMIITGAFFALLHASWIAFLPIWVLGIFLAYLFEISGSLVSPILAHVIHNLLMVGLAFFVRSLPVGLT